MFSRAVYGTHPAARMGLTPDALNKITRDDLVDFHRAHYIPNRAVLAISGDVSMFQARTVLEGKLAVWKNPPTFVTHSCHGTAADLGTEDLLHRPAERRADKSRSSARRRSSGRIPITTRSW